MLVHVRRSGVDTRESEEEKSIPGICGAIIDLQSVRRDDTFEVEQDTESDTTFKHQKYRLTL